MASRAARSPWLLILAALGGTVVVSFASGIVGLIGAAILGTTACELSLGGTWDYLVGLWSGVAFYVLADRLAGWWNG